MTSYDRTERVHTPGSGPSAPTASAGPAPVEYVGPYRLVEEIGEGGMGVVHLALDPRGRAVAIKVLRTHVAHDEDARSRLGREVETLSRIRDERVASVIDADILGPRPYIVTRYVAGVALDELVEEEGPLDPEGLLRLASGMAEAIRAIHGCGVVHRDIKPGNVLIDEGEPVLIDFGIAHLQDDVRHTVGGLVMGTPGYLSPELVEGAAITDATDWWGWAATITFAASGRPPFGRGRMDAVLSRVRSGDVDLDGVDSRLVPLLRASLSPRPQERPHADDVIDALARFAAGHAATVPAPSGQVWDEPDLHPPVAATQTLESRGTAVLPREAGPTPAGARWAPPPPPTGRQPPAGASPTAYGRDGHRPGDERQRLARADHDDFDDYDNFDDHENYDVDLDGPDDGWPGDADDDGAYTVAREGDPRIGLPMRRAALAALAVGWLGLVTARPGIAIVLLVAWSIVARATDRSVTGLVLRRYDHGRRGSDVPWAVVLAPWRLVVGVVATTAALVVPTAVAVAGVFASALLVSAVTGGDVTPGSAGTIAGGALVGLATLWWGLGGASLRRGSRSIVRALLPEGLPSQIVSGLLVGAGLLVALLAMTHHGSAGSIDWTPFQGPPFGG